MMRLRRALSVLCALLLVSGLAVAEVRVAVGSFVGNAADNRDIAVTPVFPIKALFLKGSGATQMHFTTDTMGADLTAGLMAAGVWAADLVQSLGTGTFQVGTGDNVNAVTYDYVALGGSGVTTGTYTGDAADGRNLTISPAFAPAFVTIVRNNSSTGSWRSAATAGDLSCRWGNLNCAADFIQALNSDGFQLGTNAAVNNSGSSFAYVAVAASPGAEWTGSYTGDAADNRDITSVWTKVPLFLLTKVASTVHIGYRFGVQVGDLSFQDSAVAAADCIQSMSTTGFQIGTVVNCNTTGVLHYWWAIADRMRPGGGLLWLGN
jgi:hypothetical protein